jgi:hypothetical protein
MELAVKYWDPFTRKKFFDDFATKKGFDPLIASNWYKYYYKDIRAEKVNRLTAI